MGGCTTLNNYSLVGGACSGAGGGPTAMFEARTDAVAIGAERVAVTFTVPKNSAAYSFLEMQVTNTVDADPMRVWPATIIATADTGFTVLLNGAVDTGNYVLRSTVQVNQP